MSNLISNNKEYYINNKEYVIDAIYKGEYDLKEKDKKISEIVYNNEEIVNNIFEKYKNSIDKLEKNIVDVYDSGKLLTQNSYNNIVELLKKLDFFLTKIPNKKYANLKPDVSSLIIKIEDIRNRVDVIYKKKIKKMKKQLLTNNIKKIKIRKSFNPKKALGKLNEVDANKQAFKQLSKPEMPDLSEEIINTSLQARKNYLELTRTLKG